MVRTAALAWVVGAGIGACAGCASSQRATPPARPSVTVAPAPSASAGPVEVAEPSELRFPSAQAACAEAEELGAKTGDELVTAVCLEPASLGGGADETGRWLIWPEPAGQDGDGSTIRRSQVWSALWVDASGRTLQGPRFLSTQDDGFENQKDVPELGVVRPLFDYDGDGRSELLLPVRQYEHASEGPRRLWVLTVTDDGRIVEYAPELKPVVWAEDVDGDGRPDLMLDPDDTQASAAYPAHSSVVRAGWRLAHSLPNGSFSTTDAVATSFEGGE